MKFIIFLLINISLYAQITMDNGQCFERKGNMNYIVPCPPPKSGEAEAPKQNIEQNNISISKDKSGKCVFTIGRYSVESRDVISNISHQISCEESKEYINSMFLGYEKSLSIGKKKIGDLIIKRGFSTCNIELFYGEYIFIGIMSGDENMCNNFMSYHSQIRNKKG